MKLIDAFKELNGQWTTKGWVMGMTDLNENQYRDEMNMLIMEGKIKKEKCPWTDCDFRVIVL